MNNRKIEIIEDFDTCELAEKIYNMAKDMDFEDYEEQKETELQELDEFLYYLKTVSQNEYNKDYFRTFWNALQIIASKF